MNIPHHKVFGLLAKRPHVRVGDQWVPLMEVVGLLDKLIDYEHQQPGETARHALARVNLDWHRTGKLPQGEAE